LTELEATLTSAILAAPPGKTITTEMLLQAQRGLASPVLADLPPIDFDEWLNRALSKGSISMTRLEMHIYRTAVDRASGNLSAAARSLGLSRAQLAYRLDRAKGSQPAAQLNPQCATESL
jgi:transcriptional regulator with GAF, ATPase, and Fis domain